MSPLTITPDHESLDPQDWESFRQLSHRMVDDMLDYMQTTRDRPVWQPVPDEVKERLKTAVPREGVGAQTAYEDFYHDVLPYPMGNIHPRFWGWVMGNGTPLSVMSEMLAATMNPNMGGGDHGGLYVEAQVLDWLKSMLGFPASASGLLVSGGSMANLVGLSIGRNVKSKGEVRKGGLVSLPHPLTVYASVETHSSVQKAIELLGLGSDAFRKIPVNDRFEIDLDELRVRIKTDQRNGFQPVCIIGNAGTVNTGAIDDLSALAKICKEYDLWFHVDGAFGALAYLADEFKPRLQAMTQADSLAFDLHKWLYMPFEAGCILVKDGEAHRRTFSLTPDYLSHEERGIGAGALWFSDYGIQLTRGFRALKIWMSLKEHGVNKFKHMIEKNLSQAQYLTHRIQETADLELMAPTSMNIVCYRYNPQIDEQDVLNEINREILYRLHESGSAAPSYTRLNGSFVIRAAITNHRSRREDFDQLIEETIKLGRTVTRVREQ